MKKIKNQQSFGFSLIELLVTVAILGILATMSIGIFNDYKGKANDTIAISQIQSMSTAFNASLADRDPTAMITSGFGFASVSFNRHGSAVLESTPLTIQQLLPGFVHQEGTLIFMVFYSDDRPYIITATHCKGAILSGLYGVEYTKIFSLISGKIVEDVQTTPLTVLNGEGCES